MVNSVPRRESNNRNSFRVSRASGPSAEDIKADMARRAALPKDHPDYAAPDIDIDYDKVVRPAPGVEKPGKKKKK